MTTSLLCASPRCRYDPDTGELTPWPAAPGLRLCWACRDHLAADLAALPGICRDLETNLPTGGRGLGTVRVSGTPTPGLRVDGRAAFAYGEILPILAGWAGLVAEHRGLPAPRRDPAMLARFLGRHVDWLAAHGAAGDAADEIAEIRYLGARAAYTRPPRYVELGGCPEPGCTGIVWAIMRDAAGPAPSTAMCNLDPAHEWPATEWPRLRRRMRAAA